MTSFTNQTEDGQAKGEGDVERKEERQEAINVVLEGRDGYGW